MIKKLKGWLGGSTIPSHEPSLPEELFPLDSEEFLVNPYPFYEKLREKDRFHTTSEGYLVLTHYADIVDALTEPRLGNTPSRFSTLHPSKSDQFTCANLAQNIMPFLDGPVHKEQRKLIGRLFQKQVKVLEEKLPELCQESCRALPTEFEVMTEFATPFTLKAINSLLGFPHNKEIENWSNLFFFLFTQIPSAEQRDEVNQGLDRFREWIREILSDPKATGLSADFQQAITEASLTEAVATDTLILLFADGLENVDTGIANAVHAFAKHPQEWTALCENQNLIEGAVAECLRYDSPAQYVARTVLEGGNWKGAELRKDFNILLLLAAANRDPEVFSNPKRFEINRSPNPHLSFGRGKHSCLGGKLVEKEMRALLLELSKTVKSIELISDITWQKRKGHRWIESARFRISR